MSEATWHEIVVGGAKAAQTTDKSPPPKLAQLEEDLKQEAKVVQEKITALKPVHVQDTLLEHEKLYTTLLDVLDLAVIVCVNKVHDRITKAYPSVGTILVQLNLEPPMDSVRLFQQYWKESVHKLRDASVHVMKNNLLGKCKEFYSTFDETRRALISALQRATCDRLNHENLLLQNAFEQRFSTVKVIWNTMQSLLRNYDKELRTFVSKLVQQQSTNRDRLQQLESELQKYGDHFWATWDSHVHSYWDLCNCVCQSADMSDLSDTHFGLKGSLALTHTIPNTFVAAEALAKHFDRVTSHLSRLGAAKLSLECNPDAPMQENTDRQLQCAQERLEVLRNPDRFESTEEWVYELQKREKCLQDLDNEAAVIKKVKVQTLQQTPASEFLAQMSQFRGWVDYLVGLSQQLEDRCRSLELLQMKLNEYMKSVVQTHVKKCSSSMMVTLKELKAAQMSMTERELRKLEEVFQYKQESFNKVRSYVEKEMRTFGVSEHECFNNLEMTHLCHTKEKHNRTMNAQLQKLFPVIDQMLIMCKV